MNSKSVFVKVIAAVMLTITLGTTTIIFPSYAQGPGFTPSAPDEAAKAKQLADMKGPNSGDFSHIVGWNTKAGPCVGGALGAAVIRLIYK